MSKFKGMEYKDLSEATKKRHEQLLEKIHKTGFKLSEFEKMNDDDFSKYLGIKKGKKTKYGYSNVYSHRKLIRQIKGTAERKTETINRTEKRYIKAGFTHKRLAQVKRELVMTAGNTFAEVYDKVDKHFPSKSITSKQEYTRQLLRIPHHEIQDLSDFDRETIEGYDTSP